MYLCGEPVVRGIFPLLIYSAMFYIYIKSMLCLVTLHSLFVLAYQLYLCCVFVYLRICVVYLCGEPVVLVQWGILALSRLTLGTCQHQTPLVLTIIISISINLVIIPIILATIVIFRDDG